MKRPSVLQLQITLAFVGFLASAGLATSVLQPAHALSLLAASSFNSLTSTSTSTTPNTSESSSTASTTTLANVTNISTVQISGFTLTPDMCNSGNIKVSWNPVAGAYGYRLTRDGAIVYQNTLVDYFDRGLLPGTSHIYTLQAINQISSTSISTATVIAPACTTATSGGTTATTSAVSGTTGIVPAPAPTQTPVTTTPTPVTTTKPIEDTTRVTDTTVKPQTTTSVVSGETRTIAGQALSTSGTPVYVSITETPFQEVIQTFSASVQSLETARAGLVQYVANALPPASVDAPMTEQSKKIDLMREKLTNEIQTTLADVTFLNADKLAKLRSDIVQGIRSATGQESIVNEAPMTFALATLGDQAKTQAQYNLLYKDTNRDGISDYESTHVYNLDPNKPTPVSFVEGRKLTAGEKILLGFDPTKKELVKITPEDPSNSNVSPSSGYKVADVSLTSDTKLSLTGFALPNSFVTLYIFSTPIVVTVKSDATGKWQYTLTSELEDGHHTVQVATVDTTGKILARSPSIPFTKTAQAASLDVASPLQASMDTVKPNVLATNNLVILGSAFIGLFLFALLLMGLGVKKYAHQNDTAEPIPPSPPPTV